MDVDNSRVVATAPAQMAVLPGTMEESLLDVKRMAQTGWGANDPRNWGPTKQMLAGGAVLGTAVVLGLAVGLSSGGEDGGSSVPEPTYCEFSIDIQPGSSLETCIAVTGNVEVDLGVLEGDLRNFDLSDYLPNLILISGNLNVRNNQNLNTFTLGKLRSDGVGLSVGGSVEIVGNTGLVSVNLDKLRSVTQELLLQRNGALVIDDVYSLSAVNLVQAGNIIVFGGALDSFVLPELTTITGQLTIVGDPNSDSLNSMTQIALPKLETVYTGLQIANEPSLEEISMPALTYAGVTIGNSNFIGNNPKLERLLMPAIATNSPGGAFPIQVQENPNLTFCNVAGCAPNNQCGQTCTGECPFKFYLSDVCDSGVLVCEGNVPITPSTNLDCEVVNGTVFYQGNALGVGADVDISKFLPNLLLIKGDLSVTGNNMEFFTMGGNSLAGISVQVCQ